MPGRQGTCAFLEYRWEIWIRNQKSGNLDHWCDSDKHHHSLSEQCIAKLELPSTLEPFFLQYYDQSGSEFKRYIKLCNLAELKGWHKMKGLSNRELKLMFIHISAFIACSYKKIQHFFFFIRNSGHSYSTKRFAVQHNRATFFGLSCQDCLKKSNKEVLIQSVSAVLASTR